MNQSPPDPQKAKRSPSRQWGCLKLLLIPILLAVACYSGMWLFARYGGEWVTSDQIPIPPGSELVGVSLPDELYGNDVLKRRIYLHSWTREELRTWFEQNNVFFLPKCVDVPHQTKGVRCYEHDRGPYSYGETEFSMSNPRLALYWLSIAYTVPSGNEQNWKSIPTRYFSVSIYDHQEDFDSTFPYPSRYIDISVPDIEIPEGKTAFSLITVTSQTIGCWLHFCDR
jgi:hypothetical protein